jgi:hypothetical protein
MGGRRYVIGAALVAAAVALNGCSGVRETLGLGKNAPDEFQVVSRAPLSLPPDYNLRPPEPGAPRPQEGTARDQAETAVFGSGAQPAGAQSGEALYESVPTAAPTIPVESEGMLDIDAIPTLGSVAAPSPADTAETAPAPAPAVTRTPVVGVSAGEAALLQRSGASGVDGSIRRTVDQESKDIQEADTRLLDRLIFWQDADEPGVIVDPAKEKQRLQENAALGKPVTEGETPVIERKRRALLEGIF